MAKYGGGESIGEAAKWRALVLKRLQVPDEVHVKVKEVTSSAVCAGSAWKLGPGECEERLYVSQK